MAQLEPADVYEKRLQLQVEQLAKSGADVFCLQEVNPLFPRLKGLAQRMGQFDFAGQNDLTGLKIFGRGLPLNLNSGLGLLARLEYHLKRVCGLKLSGGFGIATENFSWEVIESRYALFSEIQWRQKTLIVNAHLHHGQEPHPALAGSLQKLIEQGEITVKQLQIIEDVLETSRLRRVREIRVLLQKIAELRKNYDSVIVTGDFNCDPGKDISTLFEEAGYLDVVSLKGRELYTWDKQANPEIFDFNLNFQLPVPDFGNQKLKEILMAHNQRKTRLDYIFVSQNLGPSVKNVELWGNHQPTSQNTSDHFGLMMELV